MSLFKRFLRHEFDADIFTCLYAACTIWLLSLFRTLCHGPGLAFSEISVCIILSWVIAWLQKFLFWGEKPRSTGKRRLRGALWNLAPPLLFALVARWLGWFSACPAWAFWGFCAAVAFTVFSWWVCIQLLCRDESAQWNALLTQFKQNQSHQNKEDFPHER